MRLVVLLPILLCIGARSQNWALLNPAYKYNYANDGSDTISNQIFVTHIDTLGVDSFRYELNGVAKLCDTCAGPELYLWTNAPQFLQRSVDVGSGVWYFHDPGSFVILPNASLGTSWTYDTLANVQAIIAEVDTVDQFGTATPRKTIDLSNGDVLVISESNGILGWGGHQLIGVHGPDMGDLIPTIEGFFPYGPGDVLQYTAGDLSCTPCYGEDRTFKFTISGTSATDSSKVYSGDVVAFTHHHQTDWNFNTAHWYTYENGPSALIAGSAQLPLFDLVRSYPGQCIMPRPWSITYGSWLACIAQHTIGDNGAYRISSDSAFTHGHFFFLSPTQTECLFACAPYDLESSPDRPNGANYEEGKGLVLYRSSHFDGYEEFYLDGSVLNGYTTGTLLSDDQILAIASSNTSTPLVIIPNPANDHVTLNNAIAGSRVRILDTHGHLLVDHRVTTATKSLDVGSLAPGIYLLTMDGFQPQRFIIAR